MNKTIGVLMCAGAMMCMLGTTAYEMKKAKDSVPTFTDAERARIFKAQSAYNALAPQWQKVSSEMEAVQRMAKDKCGTEHHPDVDKDGEPVCLPQSANAVKDQPSKTPDKSANTKAK